MTTILAVQGDTWAVIGFDSQVSDESGRSFTLGRGSTKVAKNGQYLIGAAGDVRAINILAHVFVPPKPGDITGLRLDRFITSKFIPALRQCFEEQGYAPRDSKERVMHGSVILVVVNGSIYEIDEDYSWVRDSSGVYAAGTGGDYALGAFYAMLGEKNIHDLGVEATKRMTRDAMAIGIRIDAGSGPPIHVIHQSVP